MPGTPNDVTEGMGHVRPHDVTSFGGMVVCLDRHGSITVTGVQPVQAQGDMRITEWGVRPSPWWRPGPLRPTGENTAGIGALKGDLEHNHFTVGRKVNVTCDVKTGRGYELAVSLSLIGTAGATFKDLKVSYISEGEHRSFVFPITLELCPATIDVENNCGDT